MGEHMGRIALAAVVLGLVACTGGCVVAGDDDDDTVGDDDDDDSIGAVCGNGTCQTGESAASCPADCAGAPECSVNEPNSCSGETICHNTECVSAFGRTYTLAINTGTISQFNADGDTWDAVGGAPDTFVEVYLNDAEIFTTGVADDTLTPQWFDTSGAVVIPAGSALGIYVYDEDVAAPDFVFGCELDSLTADFLRYGYVPCAVASSSIDLLFTAN